MTIGHHSANALRVPDIDERVAVQQDQVRQLAGPNRAEGIHRFQEPRGCQRRRPQRFDRRQSRFNQMPKLAVDVGPWKIVDCPGIGPCENRHARAVKHQHKGGNALVELLQV